MTREVNNAQGVEVESWCFHFSITKKYLDNRNNLSCAMVLFINNGKASSIGGLCAEQVD